LKTLVTGGSGYVGSVICARLREAGHEVTGWDLVDGRDVRNPVPLAKELRQGYDAVIHCAARTLVTDSLTDPGGYWQDNLGGTASLLAAMRTARVRTVIFSSTAAVYGDTGNRDLTGEDHPLLPVTPYGASKLAAETLLGEYARLYGFTAVSLRYFNAAGAHLGADGTWAGERHDPETHLIPNVLRAARDGTAIRVCGDDYLTWDGTAVRDYVHVTDLAGAHLLALQTRRPGHCAYNLGTRSGFTVREVIGMCREVTGRDITEITVPRRPGDPARLVASAARAGTELGWKPERDLRAVVADAWAFMQQSSGRQ
jgi:UDP-glucose 4-epimerase